jgi:NTE family protein
MLVQVTPEQHEDVPRLSADITRRVGQIASNSLLHREIAEISDLSALCQQEVIPDSPLCRKLQRLRLHRVAAEAAVDGLAGASAINLDWSFLGHLKDNGAKAAATWLATGVFGDEPAQA